MSYLVDTNVISEVRKRRGDSRAKEWYDATPPQEIFFSVLTLGEIRRGIQRLDRRDHAQALLFEAWLMSLVRDFGDRVLAVTADVADAWGRMGVVDPIPPVDALLAATAQVHGLTLVTRNTADLARTGVRLLNPFEPS